MKKLFFTFVALLCFSLVSFAAVTPTKVVIVPEQKTVVNAADDECIKVVITWFSDDPDPNDLTLAEFNVLIFYWCD